MSNIEVSVKLICEISEKTPGQEPDESSVSVRAHQVSREIENRLRDAIKQFMPNLRFGEHIKNGRAHFYTNIEGQSISFRTSARGEK